MCFSLIIIIIIHHTYLIPQPPPEKQIGNGSSFFSDLHTKDSKTPPLPPQPAFFNGFKGLGV